LRTEERFRIPFLDPLLRDGIPKGILLLVEYDPDSLSYNLMLTLISSALSTGCSIDFTCCDRDPDLVRSDLKTLGVNVEALSTGDIPRLRFIDGYSTAIGLESKEKYSFPSMNLSDHSIDVLGALKGKPEEDKWRGRIALCDNLSVMLRHNPEKALIEFYGSRLVPSLRVRKRTAVQAFVKGIHSDFFYKNMENLAEGIIDVKLDTSGDVAANLIRVRSFKRGPHDAKWHNIKVGDNLAVMF
jgi:KaiC/GvpD/RAD55 family RecA-like ATPase